jgi:hypothetical protein
VSSRTPVSALIIAALICFAVLMQWRHCCKYAVLITSWSVLHEHMAASSHDIFALALWFWQAPEQSRPSIAVHSSCDLC